MKNTQKNQGKSDSEKVETTKRETEESIKDYTNERLSMHEKQFLIRQWKKIVNFGTILLLM